MYVPTGGRVTGVDDHAVLTAARSLVRESFASPKSRVV